MQIIIDVNAGFCPGVRRAIRRAEETLKTRSLTSVGDIIHNREEIRRLEQRGLQTVEQQQVVQGNVDVSGRHLFIRSHGVGEKILQCLKESAASVTDGTCPRVRRIHRLVRDYAEKGYQILIVGKARHPEVIGISQECLGRQVVIEKAEDLVSVDRTKKSLLVAQTTIGRRLFEEMQARLHALVEELCVVDTLCEELNKRYQTIIDFARSVDVVLLVGGRHSSNTNVLYQLCKQVNAHSYLIEKAAEIDPHWLLDAERIGITGSASTPCRQLDAVKFSLKSNVQKGVLNKKED
jgi:4-hydroxy-3-methylbut-2-en-1-yl diphosphate reductase